MVTDLAPTSLAIWMISFEVVPRTMESEENETNEGQLARPFLSLFPFDFEANKERPTINEQNVLSSELQRHSVEFTSNVLLPAKATRSKANRGATKSQLSSSFLLLPSFPTSLPPSKPKQGQRTHLICCPGIMKVLPTYLFFTNPSLYGISNF